MKLNKKLQQLESQVLSSEIGQKFTNHSLLSKDIWSLEELGFSEEKIALRSIHYGHFENFNFCLLYTSPSPRDRTRSRMPSSA